ncbi:MAG: [protein-PII] uridylyltransferase [Gammaproteobacteria bacterium]|nr:[protein-PII] uridylyltransferase [Gammaproteobacteria bacterium]
MINIKPVPGFIAKCDWWPQDNEQWSTLSHQLAEQKSLLKSTLRANQQAHADGMPVTQLITAYATVVDHLLCHAWLKHGLDKIDASLLAVGGYGRGELHLHSDVDLMILLADNCDEDSKQLIGGFLTSLWDTGLDIGYSVRTTAETVIEASNDITVITSLLEARILTGDQALFDGLIEATASDKIWSSAEFYFAKKEEFLARHAKYGDTIYQLEPNIKEGPGGLRDIQFLDWISKRHFKTKSLHDLVAVNFITDEECQQLQEIREHLWRVRFLLHQNNTRKEERLLFDQQMTLAKDIETNSDEPNAAIEQFMQNHYRHIRTCTQLTKVLMGHFEENYLSHSSNQPKQTLNSRFYVQADRLCVNNASVFQKRPNALLEIFLLMQLNPNIIELSSGTIRAVRENIHLIDKNFRQASKNKALFIEILRQPFFVSRELKRMHHLGILGAYWPSFARIIGRMQYDLYHVYTVDHHILTVLKEAFRLQQKDEKLPLLADVYARLPKPELLLLAALFHDVAKGRQGDHSSEGSTEARTFCLAHGLSPYDAELVAWLVENHLEMSVVAQHKDISDPETVNNFTEKTGNLIRLNYLFLLTIADIKGTNPKLWNNWRATLLEELYKSAATQLRSQGNNQSSADIIDSVKQSAMQQLKDQGYQAADIEPLWQDLPDDYFQRHTDFEISWHTRSILDSQGLKPLVHVRHVASRGFTEIFIYCFDKEDLFARISICLNRLDLSVADARIITSKTAVALYTFVIFGNNGDILKDEQLCQLVEQTLREELVCSEVLPTTSKQLVSRRLRHFDSRPTVHIKNHADSAFSNLHLHVTDYPGLLEKIAEVLLDLKITVHSARISTLGERAHDIFEISKNKQRITDPTAIKKLSETIQERITLANKEDTFTVDI